MDCGPAALKSLLDGHGVRVSYGRLREACQTDVDGTSLDSLEDIAVQLGLDAEQIMLPPDHVLHPAARCVPAIVVATVPPGMTHFLVLWRLHGPWVQIMDPRYGRRWISRRRFRAELYQHRLPVPADGWRSWADSPEAKGAFSARLDALGVRGRAADELVRESLQDSGWAQVGALDAAIRATTSVAEAGGCRRGAEAGLVVRHLFERASRCVDHPSRLQVIPEVYWSVSPRTSAGDEELMARGAVLVRVKGHKPAAARATSAEEFAANARIQHPETLVVTIEEGGHPIVELLALLRGEGFLRPAVLFGTIAAAAGALLLEPVLFRSLLGVGRELQVSGQRIAVVVAALGFQVFLLACQWLIATETRRYGRRLEVRWRVALHEKLARLADRYFRSRLTSDMAERAHSLHTLRVLPEATAQLILATLSLLLTGTAIVWLDPGSAPVAALSVGLAIALPLLLQPHLKERDLRVRTHVGGLSRFFFDSLMGLVTVRYHNAQSPIRSEHEALLLEWLRARLALQRAVAGLEGIQLLASLPLAVWLVTAHVTRGGEAGPILLLAYWALQLPAFAQQLAQLAWRYPTHRNIAARVLEIVSAPDQEWSPASRGVASDGASQAGVDVTLRDVTVRAAGLVLLNGINLRVEAGCHTAVVGMSGAGKSTLLGLLMGWCRPAAGDVWVDGTPLDDEAVPRLWGQAVWVEPGVHIWNRPLLDNLWYGATGDPQTLLPTVIDSAGLQELLGRLPDGLQTHLGEGGGLVSGGGGQRIRLARAMFRPNARLVVLDEAFAGLGRARRARLLEQARLLWRGRTLFNATHDIRTTLSFDRVLVLHRGHIVEDDSPTVLCGRRDSHYRRLLDAETKVREIHGRGSWRRIRLVDGRLVPAGQDVPRDA